MSGAVAGSVVNHRETRRLGEQMRDDLQGIRARRTVAGTRPFSRADPRAASIGGRQLGRPAARDEPVRRRVVRVAHRRPDAGRDPAADQVVARRVGRRAAHLAGRAGVQHLDRAEQRAPGCGPARDQVAVLHPHRRRRPDQHHRQQHAGHEQGDAARPPARGRRRTRRRAPPSRPRPRPTAPPAGSAARRRSARRQPPTRPVVRPSRGLACRPMPIPAGDRPFDPLAAELVADQCAASPTLGSVLGLTEYDEALPDLSADGIAATASASRTRGSPGWAPSTTAELTDDERIDRDLALMVLRGRVLMRDWADWRRSPDHYAGTALSVGVRAAHHPAAARARAGGGGRRPAAGHARPARAGHRPTSTRRWRTRRCCAGRWARSAPARSTPGRSPTSSTTRAAAAAGRARPARWPRRRTSASASTSRRWSRRPPATGRSARSATTRCCARPRASATAPGSCARRARPPTTSWPPT